MTGKRKKEMPEQKKSQAFLFLHLRKKRKETRMWPGFNVSRGDFGGLRQKIAGGERKLFIS